MLKSLLKMSITPCIMKLLYCYVNIKGYPGEVVRRTGFPRNTGKNPNKKLELNGSWLRRNRKIYAFLGAYYKK